MKKIKKYGLAFFLLSVLAINALIYTNEVKADTVNVCCNMNRVWGCYIGGGVWVDDWVECKGS